MKKWMIVAAAVGMVAMVAGVSKAGVLKEGTQEIILSGNYDPDAFDDYNYTLRLGYGRFIMDNLEIGVRGLATGTKHVTIDGIQGLIEYNIPMSDKWGFFVQGTVGGLYGKVEDPNSGNDVDNETVAASVAGGVKYFLTETVAISGDVEYTKCADDVYVEDDELVDDNVEFNLALRFYIP
jgi:hypothetical protein